MDARPTERYFFVHIQKTAGTSLIKRLRRHFPHDAFYPSESGADLDEQAPHFAVSRLLERWAVRGDDVRMLTGHFPLCTADLLGGGFTTMTVVREPVERTLSYLRHHRALTPADADLPLEAVYEDEFRFEGLVHNHMTKMLGMTTEQMDAGMLTVVDFTPDVLERAKRNVDAIDVIGLQRCFDAFCAELERRFGWDLGAPVVMNRTGGADDVSEAFRARIAEDNAADVELYEHAERVYRERLPASEAVGEPW
jgi:hypothetical protein